jgi:diguanylate cyclase (GGDEF)-like protein
LRGGAAGEFARLHLLYVSPLEAFTIPLILALIFLYKNSGMGAFLCLGVSLLLFSFLFRHLNRVEEGVRKVNQTLSDRTSELATLNTIGREVSASLDPARVCEVVSRSCRQVFPTGVVFIVLADPEQGGITARYVDRGERLTPEDRLPVGPGFVDWVMRTLRPLMIQDLFEDGAEMPFPAVMHDPTLRSLLLVPLVVENRAAGVMGVADPVPGKFDFQRLSVLTTIAQQTAVAIQNARHYQMATVDQMTGLYLRHHFVQRLTDERTRALRYRSPFAVIMLDLDSFKEINDRLGHNAGDQFLRMASEAIKQSLRGSDVACRWGGDEFCILLPQTDVEASRATAERIRKAIAALGASFSGAGSTASAGIATYPNDFDGSMEELVRRADQALYRAKREGRDRVAIFSRAPAEAIPVREAGGRLKGRPR